MQMLVRLLYASRASQALTPDLIDHIFQNARKANVALGITGALCHSQDMFMQVLEGGRDAVNRLYHGIIADSRHHDVVMLHYEEIVERRFANWSMGQIDFARVNPSILLKYSAQPTLDPYALSGRTSMAMLEELLANAAVLSRSQ